MSVGVVYLLEVIQIDEQDGELVAVARRTVDFGLQSLVKVAGVIQPGAIVGDGEFLNLLHRTCIFNGDGGVIANRLKKERFLVGKMFHLYVDQLNNSQNSQLGPQG